MLTPPFELTGDLGAHDPSTIIRCGDTFWVFHTGRGGRAKFSTDLRHWTKGPAVFAEPLAWWPEVAPGFDGCLWAPDIVRLDDRYALYYSVSSWGKRTSAIGLATNRTLNPDDPGFAWHDEGIIVQTTKAHDYNAIDPALLRDDSGHLWLAFGSFWSGIKLVELDPRSGKRMDHEALPRTLAGPPLPSPAIEAPYLFQRDGFYYLFVNWGRCCRGARSTYNVRVGRSREVSGPYLDRTGRSMLEGGGTLFLKRRHRFIGPGHVAIFAEDDAHWCSYHFYDEQQNGRPTLMVERLSWDEAGWPSLA